MKSSPFLISLLVAFLVSGFTVLFLKFVPEVNLTMLFVVGLTSFFLSFLLVFYTIDLIVFQEVNEIYKSIKKLQIQDFNYSKKNLLVSVSPLKKLNREISSFASKKQVEINELKENEAFRREFLADVSHELKTPIFAAQGFVHTLLDGAMNDEEVSKRFLKKAAKSLDGLEALVRDLVTLSQVESGQIKMELEKINLVPLVEDIFEQLEGKADKRGVKLKLLPKGIKRAIVIADPQRIAQVIINFVDNSIKYGKEKGTVIVNFEEKEKEFTISIKDDGPGMEQEHLNRIFERFYRIDKSRSRKTGGTGLGLAIVKHILSAHNSQIEVLSNVGEGTQFSFKLLKIE